MGRNWAWKLKEKSWACGRLFYSECWEQCCTFRVILLEAEGFLCPTRLPWECSGEPSDRPRHVLWVNPGGQLSPTLLLAHNTSWWERGWKQKSTSVKICELSSQLKFLKKEINRRKKKKTKTKTRKTRGTNLPTVLRQFLSNCSPGKFLPQLLLLSTRPYGMECPFSQLGICLSTSCTLPAAYSLVRWHEEQKGPWQCKHCSAIANTLVLLCFQIFFSSEMKKKHCAS